MTPPSVPLAQFMRPYMAPSSAPQVWAGRSPAEANKKSLAKDIMRALGKPTGTSVSLPKRKSRGGSPSMDVDMHSLASKKQRVVESAEPAAAQSSSALPVTTPSVFEAAPVPAVEVPIVAQEAVQVMDVTMPPPDASVDEPQANNEPEPFTMDDLQVLFDEQPLPVQEVQDIMEMAPVD